jgi:hypothetical protein
MDEGRLIRASKRDGDVKAIAYVVALSDKAAAIALIRRKVADPEDNVEDLGRVSAALISALAVPAGGFIRIEGVKHASQQQQQPQTTAE